MAGFGNGETRLGWMALALTPGLGPTRVGRIVQQLGDAGRVFDLPLTRARSS